MFARHLASCGFTLKQQLQDVRMDHATLRAAVIDYFSKQLAEAKARHASLGPHTPEAREQVVNTVSMLEEGNSEFWQLVGRDQAEQELGRFFEATGLSRDEYWPHAMRVLDEIRKGKIGVAREILAFGGRLDGYDFSEAHSPPQRAEEPDMATCPGGAPDAPQRVTGAASGPLLSTLFSERKMEAQKSGEWSPKLLDDYQTWTDLFIELIGDRPLFDYKKPDARKFKEILTQLPSNRGKHAQTKGLPCQCAFKTDPV